jgi:hypothetical protein
MDFSSMVSVWLNMCCSGMQMVVAPEDDEIWAPKEKSATNVDLNSAQLEGCESRPSFRQRRY